MYKYVFTNDNKIIMQLIYTYFDTPIFVTNRTHVDHVRTYVHIYAYTLFKMFFILKLNPIIKPHNSS